MVARTLTVRYALLRELGSDQRFGDAQRLLDGNFRHRQLDRSAFKLREIEYHVHQRQQMLLRLMNALDVLALLVVQAAVDVLLQDFQVAGDSVQRRAKLVAETRE